MLMKEKLTEALEAKQNDITTFIWKFAKNQDGTQDSIRLIDATPEQLNEFYNHCHSMLYSTDKKNPGRYPLLDLIKEQRKNCNVELFLRKLNEGAYSNGESYPRRSYRETIDSQLYLNKERFPKSEWNKIPISTLTKSITGTLPREFGNLDIESVRQGCVDALGILNTKHLTFSFIINLGVYLTPEERKNFNEKDEEGNKRSILEVIKERLNLKPFINLRIKPSGLSYTELRAMLTLRPKRYSELTTQQLETLRNKILFKLEEQVNEHINSWEDHIHKIELVAQSKGIELKKC